MLGFLGPTVHVMEGLGSMLSLRGTGCEFSVGYRKIVSKPCRLSLKGYDSNTTCIQTSSSNKNST